MIVFDFVRRVTRRVGLDTGRAVANADPHPARVAQDRHEQYQAIHRRVGRTSGPPRSPEPAEWAGSAERADEHSG